MKFKVLSILASAFSSFLPLSIISGNKVNEKYKSLIEDQFLKNNENKEKQTQNGNLPTHNYWSIMMASGSFSFLKKLVHQLDINKPRTEAAAKASEEKKKEGEPQKEKGLFHTSAELYPEKLQKLMNSFLKDLNWTHLIAPIEDNQKAAVAQQTSQQQPQAQSQQNNSAQHFWEFKTKFLAINGWIELSIFSLVLLSCSSLLLFGWTIFLVLDPNISKTKKIKKISYHLITQFPGWLIIHYLNKKNKKIDFDFLFPLNKKRGKECQISSFKLSNLNYRVDNYSILKDISCNLEKNEFYSIIGPNGAGKTTFLKHLGGILQANSGNIYIGEEELKNINSKDFWEKTVYIPQELNIQGDTPVYDFLLYSRYSSISRLEKVNKLDHIRTLEVIKAVGIQDLRWNRMGELSGGQRQKVILASILMKDVELILMDEPTTFLDVHNRNFFISFLKKLHQSGKTIIANLHNLTEISQLSTRIIALKDGEIFKIGDKKEILQADFLNQLYDLNLPIENWQSLLSIKSSDY